METQSIKLLTPCLHSEKFTAFFSLIIFSTFFSGLRPPERLAAYNTGPETGLFVISPLASNAYQKIASLRFDEALMTLEKLSREEPNNLIAPFLENCQDFLSILVDDNRDTYERLVRRMNPRLAKIARGDKHSPFYLYTQAEIHLQWAFLRIRFGEYFNGLRDIRQAYALLNENRRRHPNFLLNYKSLGLLHALVGNVPDEYRWAIKALGGMSGTVPQGMEEIRTALVYARENQPLFEREIRVIYAFLQLHLQNDKNAAWQTLADGRFNPGDNPLAAFVLAHMAIRTGRNNEAIRLLEQCPAGGDYYPFAYRNYLLGIAKMNRLDADANQPLETFTQTFRGENNLKEAYQKLAWHHLIHGDENGYRSCMALVEAKGADRAEPDKAALREASGKQIPDVYLLRARLLFDGGYYQRAYRLLREEVSETRYTGHLLLEYNYRLGRIAHEIGQAEEAIRRYTQTIESGARQPGYFACNAALQLGMLLEKQGDKTRARAAYRRCLKLKPDDYAAALHARAKAGLKRVE